MEEIKIKSSELVHLARLALSGSDKDIQLYIRRIGRRYRNEAGELTEELQKLLRDMPTRNSPLRRAEVPNIPVDIDSRLQLLRIEHPPVLENEPIFSDVISGKLESIIAERNKIVALESAGVLPTTSCIFSGPPGVGKTLAARWLARSLELPLLILDLSAVMSSFLGRTGTNLRHVLDYARSVPSILLLDEFDAIAKRRDDSAEVGELKRLVTVLLQEIDNWNEQGILIAATNHADLLDPAVWRRFDLIVEFPVPSFQLRKRYFEALFCDYQKEVSDEFLKSLAAVYEGNSYSEIMRDFKQHLRNSIVHDIELSSGFFEMIKNKVCSLPQKEKISLAIDLIETGEFSQREINRITGVSRDTLRKASR